MTSVATPLVDVLSATPPVSVAEAIAVVRHVSRVPDIGAPGPWPSLDRVLLTPDGQIDIVTGTSTARATSAVTWLGRILYALVASADDGHKELPRGLSLIVTRATGSNYDEPDQAADLRAFPPYSSVQNLLDALDRYASPDDGAAVTALAERCATRGVSPDTALVPGAGPREDLPSGLPPRDLPQAELLFLSEESPGASRRPSPTFADLARLREERGIGIAQISTDTRLSARLIEDLERGDLSRWPRGLFARSYLTAYAKAIGVEPADVLGLADPAVVRDEGIEPVRELRQREEGRRWPRLPIGSAGSFGPAWRAAAATAVLLALGAVVMPRVQSGAGGTRLPEGHRHRPGKDITAGSTGMSQKQRSAAATSPGAPESAPVGIHAALAATSHRIRQLQTELHTLEGRLGGQGHDSSSVRARIDQIDALLLGLDARRRRLRIELSAAELGALDRGKAASAPRRGPPLPKR